jgi:hypothetical protein
MMDSTDSVGFTFYTALPAKMRDQASMAMNSSTSTRKNIHTQERTDVVRDVIKPNLIYAGEKRSHSLCNERILNQQYNPYPGFRPCYQNEYLSHSDRGEHFVHVNQNNQSYHGIPDATHRDLYNSEPHLIGKNSPIDFDSPRKRPSSWRSHQQQPLSDDDHFFGQSMNSLSNKHIENNDFSSIDSSANVKSTPNLNIEYEEKGMRGQLDSTSLNNSENVGSLQEGTLICTILQESDRKLGTNFINAIVDELEVAFFCNRDRKGKRSAFPIGFPGLACRHCKGFSKGRKGGRYFHSSIKTMSDSKKSLLAMYHHLLGCERCPYETKALIYSLFDDHIRLRKEGEKRHSTQRAFFRRIWAHLHREDCIEQL